MHKYQKHATTLRPVTDPLPGQVPNHAGGYVFPATPWQVLDRFLMLGTVGGTYYATEAKLTFEAVDEIEACIREDGKRVVERVVQVSDSAIAPHNDPALFVLALCMCASAGADSETVRAAAAALPKVARIPTHLFHFIAYARSRRGWGRSLKNAVGRWYSQRGPEAVARATTKYQRRDGWSNRDAVRLGHAKPTTAQATAMLGWVADPSKPWPEAVEKPHALRAFEDARTATSLGDLLVAIGRGAPREAIPTEWLARPAVWMALVEKMGYQALLRSLGAMTANLALADPRCLEAVIAKLGDVDFAHAQRAHPFGVLLAALTYGLGHGVRGHNTWTPLRPVMEQLDRVYSALAANSEQHSLQRILVAVDASGSMHSGECVGTPIQPIVAAVAVAATIARTAPNAEVVLFTTEVHERVRLNWGIDSIAGLVSQARRVDGGTDVGSVYQYALKSKHSRVLLLTDGETWHGYQPKQLLDQIRRTDKNARFVYCPLTATKLTAIDVATAFDVLHVVGLDASLVPMSLKFLHGDF